MIRIGATRIVMPGKLTHTGGFEIFWKYGDGAHVVPDTEAVKRLVEDHRDLCRAMHDLMAEIGAPAWAVEKLRESAAILAPFTESDVSLVDSGLRSCATPKNDGSTSIKGADQ